MWKSIRAIAHRCGGGLAPENSLSGLRVAASLGFYAVEFDVMLSADGSPWVLHDETLERTTNGVGALAATSDFVLQQLHCAKGWGGIYAQEPLPRLEEALTLCAQLGLRPNIEIKPAQGAEVITGQAVAACLLGQGNGVLEPLLSSFSIQALQAAALVAPNCARALLVEDIPEDWAVQMHACGASALHCAAEAVEQAGEVLAAGIVLRCYTVNELERADRLFKQGVCAVFTDALSEFTPALTC